MEKIEYLIIGNGIAGLAAAKEIRNNDECGSIALVSSESTLTYYRVKLTEYISKDFQDEDLLVSKKNWYDEKNINVILSKIVENINIEKSIITLDDGKRIQYEKLLIATGGKPYIPPVNGKYKKGVFALRTIRDLRYIKDYLKEKDSVSIVGGGLLGLEAAWSLKQLGKEVNIIEFESYLLPKQLDTEISNKLETKLSDLGFKIFLSSKVEEIVGEGEVLGINLNGERSLDAGAVLISAGIRSNIDLIRDTTIEFDRGIIVDKNLKTNIENVYAAGDVVEIHGMTYGLWTAANDQGKVAGANMTGKDMEYIQPKIFTTLQIGDIKVFSVGIINDFDRVYEYKDEEQDIHHKIFTKEGKMLGGILFGDIKEIGSLRKAVLEQLDVEKFISTNSKFK